MASDFTDAQKEAIHIFKWTDPNYRFLDKCLNIRYIFDHFNKGKDGKISVRELGILMRSFNQSPTESELQDLIQELDGTGGTDIDFETFVKILSDAMNQECTDQEFHEIFKVFDKDNNGMLSSEEFRAALGGIGENLSKEETEEMILEADTDGDGQINFDDFISMMRE